MVRDLRHLLHSTTPDESIVKERVPGLIPQGHRIRVFSQRGAFRCGLCGKAYSDLQLAWVCVAACATVEIEKMGVEDLVEGERNIHRCPMCLKGFVNRQDAVICFERCRDKALAHLPAEAMRLAVVSVPGERPEILRGQDLAAKKLLPKATPSAPKSETRVERVSLPSSDPALLDLVPLPAGASLADLDFALDEPAAGSLDALTTMGNAEGSPEWQVSSNSPFEDPAPDSSVSLPAPEKPEEPGFTRKPGQKPFIRDGARYVCTACNTRYFTRQEAEQCFESHPLIT